MEVHAVTTGKLRQHSGTVGENKAEECVRLSVEALSFRCSRGRVDFLLSICVPIDKALNCALLHGASASARESERARERGDEEKGEGEKKKLDSHTDATAYSYEMQRRPKRKHESERRP